MISKNLEQVWDQLRGKRSQTRDFLEEVRINKFRGIKNLRVPFSFPVSVIAGPNATGKSTVLFVAACAYNVPESGPKDFVPSTFFPNLSTKTTELSDQSDPVVFEYYYLSEGQRMAMNWSRHKSWGRSYQNQKNVRQPQRKTYIRTLANLTNPSEVRSVLQLGKKNFTSYEITSDLISLAQRILTIRYDKLQVLSLGEKSLLFVNRTEGRQGSYSEFHMSAGERAILRLSMALSKLENALVLIDEIEAGLHPFTQQILMLELQRLALRNNLQIILTSHSPVILESVPVEGRIFLERSAEDVTVMPAYRDIFQKALYGQSIEKLSILCEDEEAEAILNGVMDVINIKFNLRPDDYIIGRDTGKHQFEAHIEALSKFQKLDSFLFALDGDSRDLESKLKAKGIEKGFPVQPLFLPSDTAPEIWAWNVIKTNLQDYSQIFGLDAAALDQAIKEIDQMYESAADKPSNIAKNKFVSLGERLRRGVELIFRTIARTEAEANRGEMSTFLLELESLVNLWRSRRV
jgi:predicted ATP-binding protein involved in virulence